MIAREALAEVAARDRQMFHVVWNADTAKVASVLEHGLERTTTNYEGFWESRPDHVYMGRREEVNRIFFRNVPDGKAYVNDRGAADWAMFSVDLTRLDPAKVNPDEDHFHFYGGTEAREASRRFHLPFSPCKWAWDWAEYLGIRTPASLGEWADAVDLGSDPETTRYSAMKGRLSYKGIVPPFALRFVKSNLHLPTDLREVVL